MIQHKISEAFEKKIKSLPLTEDDVVKITAFLNLMNYIDASFPLCPACGNIVSLSWGWCPYHATSETIKLTDTNTNSRLKDEFISFLKTYYNKTTIREIIEPNDYNKNRLLVHWSEFEIHR